MVRQHTRVLPGNDPNLVPAGTAVPAGNSGTITIDLNAGDFQSATIESGGIRVVFRNELGFDLSTLTSSMLSGGTQISNTSNVSNVNHGDEVELLFPFNQGDILEVPSCF